MRTALCITTLCVSLVVALGQGTTHFIESLADSYPGPVVELAASLRPVSPVPNGGPGGGAWFNLNTGYFTGGGGVQSSSPIRFVEIYTKNGEIFRGAFEQGLRDAASQYYSSLLIWDHVVVSDAQTADMIKGDWTVRIGVEGFAGTAFEGQIVAVPEPASWALAIGGLALVTLYIRRNPARQWTKSYPRGVSAIEI